jgi:DNA-binding transcriptional ArsR family regulator
MLAKNHGTLAAKRLEYAQVFAALGDRTRLSLVSQLAKGQPRSITELTEDSRLTRQAITKHLRILEEVGLVRCLRVGRESLFEFEPAPIKKMKTYLEEVSEQWDQTLDRLKMFVEK